MLISLPNTLRRISYARIVLLSFNKAGAGKLMLWTMHESQINSYLHSHNDLLLSSANSQPSDPFSSSFFYIYKLFIHIYINYQKIRKTRTRKFIWLKDCVVHHHIKKLVVPLVGINDLGSKWWQKLLNLDNDTSIFKWLSFGDFSPFEHQAKQERDGYRRSSNYMFLLS